jgi:hypothetical protein
MGCSFWCGSVLDNNGVVGAVCAFDEVRRNKGLERARAETSPIQSNRTRKFRSYPLAGDATDCQLVQKTNIQRVEIEELSPLDFLGVSYRKISEG